MIKIPLSYSNKVFAHALIDDNAEPLSSLGRFSVTLPRRIRRVAGKRPDVILGFLQEDPLTVRGCTPFISMVGTQILLVHLIVRGQLSTLLVQHHHQRTKPCDYIRAEINYIRQTIGRIVYANGDRTDCRRENIREI